jgi:hypothetical protein
MLTIHLQMSHTGATTLGVSGFFYRPLSCLIFDINKREDVPSNLKKDVGCDSSVCVLFLCLICRRSRLSPLCEFVLA